MERSTRRVLSSVLAGVIAPFVFGSEPLRVPTERVALARSGGEPRAGVSLLELDPAALRELRRAGSLIVEGFPLPGGASVDLELSAFHVLAPGARFVVVDEQGERPVPAPDMRFLRGVVSGDPRSLVTLSVFDDRIAGFVRAFDREYTFGPEEYDLARPGSRNVRIRDREIVEDEPGGPLCDGPLEPDRRRGPVSGWAPAGPSRTRSITGDTLLKARIAVDATVEWHDHFGSLTAAQNYILNLMAQISTIYENEVRVQIEVPYVRVFTAEPDPYTDGSTSTSTLLSEMRAEWNANQTAVSRTAAHLFSIKTSGGSGLAYLDVLCDNDLSPGSSNDYGVSIIPGNGDSFEKTLVSHEIGHNFSSPHTHCYSPEIDQCYNLEAGCYSGTVVQTPGTIMSYCDTRLPEFHARVEDEKIRPGAEAAYPLCIDTAGLPADIREEDGSGLRLDHAASCPGETLQNDDDSLNSYFGASGTAQLAWIKRFTPGCYPFQLDRVDILIGHSPSVSVGRPIRVVVYTDPAGTGAPSGAVLAYFEDTTVQVVSSSTFNEYTLASPVIVTSGDLYVGAYDLLADAPDTFIVSQDTSTSGDSWYAFNSTDPLDFTPRSGTTWMLRGQGGPVPAGSLLLSWGVPCNDVETPGQDYGVYRGGLDDFTSYTSLTCSTGRETSYLAAGAPDDSFFVVVPRTSVNEGSYGKKTEVPVERPVAALPCKPQATDPCP